VIRKWPVYGGPMFEGLVSGSIYRAVSFSPDNMYDRVKECIPGN